MAGLDAILERPRPSSFQQFIKEPCIFIATKLYNWRRFISFTPPDPVSVVCISDTHNKKPSDIPPGDILIHAGDLTQAGTPKEIQTCLDWLNLLPHRTKIVIAGNHDILLDHTQPVWHADATSFARESLNWGEIIYLNSESTTAIFKGGRRLNIYGCPLTPRHGNWAFQYPRQEDLWQAKVPEGTDILVTHGPPKGHLDAGHLGCQYLLDELWRKRPRLHVFGHVHDGYGVEWVRFDGLQRAYETVVIAGGGLPCFIG